jgi:N-acetylglutamate synthase
VVLTVCPMAMTDYEDVLLLWQASEGVGLSEADAPARICSYLERNPELSFVAREGTLLAGAVLCGHDGRRGFIHHLAVHPSYRRRGLGRRLVEQCLHALADAGIDKCHLFVFHKNIGAVAFWERLGWQQRLDLITMSRRLEPGQR